MVFNWFKGLFCVFLGFGVTTLAPCSRTSFSRAGIGSGSGFDSEIDSDPVSSVSPAVDSSNLESDFSICVSEGLGGSF